MKTYTVTLEGYEAGTEGAPVEVQAASRVDAAMRGALALGLAEASLPGDDAFMVRFTHTGTVKVRQAG